MTVRLAIAVVIILAVLTSPVAAESKRIALLIGAAKGEPGEPLLRFAEADADRVAPILRDVGGFAPEMSSSSKPRKRRRFAERCSH